MGFYSYQGTVHAAQRWGGQGRSVELMPALPFSLEAMLHQCLQAAGVPVSADFKRNQHVVEAAERNSGRQNVEGLLLQICEGTSTALAVPSIEDFNASFTTNNLARNPESGSGEGVCLRKVNQVAYRFLTSNVVITTEQSERSSRLSQATIKCKYSPSLSSSSSATATPSNLVFPYLPFRGFVNDSFLTPRLGVGIVLYVFID